jgi:CDP-glycerol glycerophosphotransferase (TagB/SpsB family)
LNEKVNTFLKKILNFFKFFLSDILQFFYCKKTTVILKYMKGNFRRNSMKNLIKKLLSVRNRRKILRFLNKAWRAFCSILPLRNVVLFYSVRADGKLLENAKAVYDGLDAKKIVFAHKLPHSVKIKPLAYFYLMTSKVIVTDDYVRYMRVIKLRKEQKLIQIWHACGAFKTVGLERMGKPGAPAFDTNVHKCYTAMTVSSPLAAAHYAEAFGIDESKIVSLGVPRTDIFFDEEYKKEIIPKVKAAFPQIENADEVIMYAPTFRGINARYAYFPMDMIDFDGFGEYLEKHNSVMLIKMHPFVREPLPIPEKYKDRIIDASSYREINNMLFVTDLLITDYSSVIYEFSLFNKPMLFYAFDRMKYEADRGFYEPYAKMVPGKIVRTSEDLIASLEARDFEYEKVAPFVKKNFSYTDGKSTDRIIDQLILKNK